MGRSTLKIFNESFATPLRCVFRMYLQCVALFAHMIPHILNLKGLRSINKGKVGIYLCFLPNIYGSKEKDKHIAITFQTIFPIF